MEKLLILDSNSIINRAFYGIRTLNAPDGTPTNAIYGFINILLKLINDQKPTKLLAAFDLKAPTFRHKMYTEYKANRSAMPDELAQQMPLMKDILSYMNIPILQLEGYEADDIIGTVSRICGENGIECLIATGDRDDLQLVSDTTAVILASTKMGQSVTELYNENTVRGKYGVSPLEFIDMKALMGDKSDNIPGVSGIGEKTASKLISQFSTIENLYKDIESADITPRIKNKLIAEKEQAFLSRKLAEIDKNVPIKIDFNDAVFDDTFKSSQPELYDILNRLGLKSIIKKLALSPSSDSKTAAENNSFFDDKTIEIISSAEDFEKKVSTFSSSVSVYTDITDNSIVCAAVSDGQTAYQTAPSMTSEDIKRVLSAILSDSNTTKYTCGVKQTMTAFGDVSLFSNITFDAAIAAYLCDPSKPHDINTLALSYLGVYIEPEEQSGQISLLDDEPISDLTGKYALITYALKDVLNKKIEENGQHELYYKVELPLTEVLASMQLLGFTLDIDEIRTFGDMLAKRIDEKERAIYDAAGEEFNINSPKQLGTILFEKLQLPGGKKTKSGYSTKADILEKLKGRFPIVDDILEYRSYTKLKSTYCDGLTALVDPVTNRIHSVFHQTGTVTGRISSSDPNMQNIPTRTELGRELRKMFVAKDGCVLIDADYSQIELRILAHMSGDETMIEAFRNGADIHAVTASKILGIPIDELTKEQRSSAKAINFGIIYGMGEYTLSQDLNIPFKQAKKYMDDYFAKYSGVRAFLDKLKAEGHEMGHVKTLMNRIRYIPELKSSNAQLRSFGERAAMNTPIQGSAADIIKLAMVKVYDRLKKEYPDSKLILQVHDELIIEARMQDASAIKSILREEMENAVSLSVPLIVDMAEGHSWYDAK